MWIINSFDQKLPVFWGTYGWTPELSEAKVWEFETNAYDFAFQFLKEVSVLSMEEAIVLSIQME